MFEIVKSVDIDFAHHVSGHMGKCINIHGHTWKFEMTLGAYDLDDNGFVVDFGILKAKVLEPVKHMLDHSFVISEKTFKKSQKELMLIGRTLLSTRKCVDPACIDIGKPHLMSGLNSGRLWECGGMSVTTFLFTPTSERLAEWFYEVAEHVFRLDERVVVREAKVYEQLHPVEACAVYRRNPND